MTCPSAPEPGPKSGSQCEVQFVLRFRRLSSSIRFVPGCAAGPYRSYGYSLRTGRRDDHLSGYPAQQFFGKGSDASVGIVADTGDVDGIGVDGDKKSPQSDRASLSPDVIFAVSFPRRHIAPAKQNVWVIAQNAAGR